MRTLCLVFVAGAAAHSSAQLVTLAPGSGRLFTLAESASGGDQFENLFTTPNFFEKSANSSWIGAFGPSNWDIRSNGTSNSAVLVSNASEFEIETFGMWASSFNVLNTGQPRAQFAVAYVTRFTLASLSTVTLSNRHEGGSHLGLVQATNFQTIFRQNSSFVGQLETQYNQPGEQEFLLEAGSYFITTTVAFDLRPNPTALVNHQSLFRDRIRVQAVPEPLTMMSLATGLAVLVRRKTRG